MAFDTSNTLDQILTTGIQADLVVSDLEFNFATQSCIVSNKQQEEEDQERQNDPLVYTDNLTHIIA